MRTKKAEKIMLIAAVVLVIAGAVLSVTAASAAGFDMSVLSDEYSDVEYKINDVVTGIDIDAVDENVRFHIAEGNEMLVVCSERSGITHDVSMDNGVLKIKRVDNRKWYEQLTVMDFGAFVGYRGITVYLPPCALEQIKIETVSGDVVLPDIITVGDISVTTTSGDISADFIYCEKDAMLKSTSGNLRFKGRADSLSLHSTSGDVSVSTADVRHLLSIKTVSGDIFVVGVNMDDFYDSRFDISATSGDVTIFSSNATNITIKTVSGDVTCTQMHPMDYEVSTVSGSVDVPSPVGINSCRIQTTSGDVKVTVAE